MESAFILRPLGEELVKNFQAERESLETAVREFLAMNEQGILRASREIAEAFSRGGKALFFGNGGSAAEAQHLAAELVNRMTRDRPALAALALSTDTSSLTSIANDSAYERVFSRQMEALGRRGDVAIALSTWKLPQHPPGAGSGPKTRNPGRGLSGGGRRPRPSAGGHPPRGASGLYRSDSRSP